MTRHLYIDPGKHASGWAVFHDDVLIRAGFSAPQSLGHGPWITHITFERPQIYTASRSKGDPNDLLDLTLAAGVWIGLHPGAVVTTHAYTTRRGGQGTRAGVLPHDWKHTAPKRVTTARAREALTADELARVPNITKGRGDMWDAIALGLVSCGRVRMR